MGLPIASLVIATNENDILDRFWRTGQYQKHPVHGKAAEGGLPADGVNAQPEGVKGTYSPAMDILVSSSGCDLSHAMYFALCINLNVWSRLRATAMVPSISSIPPV